MRTRRRRTKRLKILRKIVAENLRAEMQNKYGARVNTTTQAKLLAHAVGISPETIRRTLVEESGATVDTLELLARELAFRTIDCRLS